MNQNCHHEGSLTLDRSRTMDEEGDRRQIMRNNLRHRCLQILTSMSLLLNLGYAAAQTPQGQMTTGKPPYNIVFIIVDQRTYRLLAGSDYSLPAIDAMARHGVRFENH